MNTGMLATMVRLPLSPEQVRAGQRLGMLLREARAGRDPALIARQAGISPETLRKIEVGRIPSPSFGTVVGLCSALGVPLQDAVEAWEGVANQRIAM
jgi:DNA-binding Xre family transcriptional regulator